MFFFKLLAQASLHKGRMLKQLLQFPVLCPLQSVVTLIYYSAFSIVWWARYSYWDCAYLEKA